MPAPSPLFSFDGVNWRPVRLWAMLAVLTLALSGLAPLLLIAGRASVYADMALVKQWFAPILVVHVNLSVGLWFLAMAMVILLTLGGIRREWLGIHKASAISFLLGIFAIAVSPLAGGETFTSNYIPVQNNPAFFMGLGFVFASLLLMVGGRIMFYTPARPTESLCQFTLLTLLGVLACFVFSFLQHPRGYGGESFYEIIFWGGGHVLQLVYVQLGMFAWIMLADTLKIPHPPLKFLNALFGLLWLNSVAVMVVYWLFDVNDGRHLQIFTWQMIAVTGSLPSLLALWYVFKLRQMQWRLHRPAAGCFLLSLLLFLLGGAIGLMIEGSNVTIPAHYHGSTVGITLALMGVMLVLLPKIGGKDVAGWRLAVAQPWLYGIGQVFHVIGLALAGGYHIARKTAGSLDAADHGAAAAMQVMRLGGLLAVLGGGIFVVIAMRSLWKSKLSH